MLYERIINERQQLKAKISTLQKQLTEFPEGKLICATNGKYTKWYRSSGHKPSYLPKSEYKLAEQLARKQYLLIQLENLLREKEAIDFYLKHHDMEAYQKEKSFVNLPGFKELLGSEFAPLSEELNEWAHTPYERNNKYPENLIHKAYSGNLVRSKSEELIDMFLCKNKIPFRYECALRLGTFTIFPDFTIRHPKTGEVYYWEHFGRMDDTDYAKKVYDKMQLYTSHGIVPTFNLIATYETKAKPLTAERVEQVVESYFL